MKKPFKSAKFRRFILEENFLNLKREDNLITEEEIKAQSDKVVAILQNMETKYSEEQLAEIKNLLAESSVLYAIYNFHSLQNINL